jgi:hypothetical protein
MRFYVAGALVLFAFAYQVRMIMVFRQMMREVNAALPGGSQIPEFGISLLRGRVIGLHRQFFPSSALRRKMYIAWTIEMIAFISALACVVRFTTK